MNTLRCLGHRFWLIDITIISALADCCMEFITHNFFDRIKIAISLKDFNIACITHIGMVNSLLNFHKSFPTRSFVVYSIL